MANPVCPAGCASALPVVDFSLCAPKTNRSQIGHIYIAKENAAPFDDVEDPAEWATRLSQTSVADDDVIRPLTVIGEKPRPSSSPVTISGGRTVYPLKTHTINFRIDETTQKNHDFMRALECGGTFRIWYTTRGGVGFGPNEGISASVTIDLVLTNGENDLMTLEGTITWQDQFTEERYVDPLA